MTTTLSLGGEVIADVIDIEVSPSFKEATRSTAEALAALKQGLMEISFTIEDSGGSFEKIVSQLKRGTRQAKPKITDRQIYKTMRMRGIR